ncbi:MAG TPA: glycosyltransferase family 2 protein [Polyangiaceae bacterium]|nr:glycosyltransferase family 2 protein [Polyangiaceae bacterium]
MTLGTGLDILLFLLGSPLHFAAAYLLFATLLSAPLRRPVAAEPSRRFRFVVPAHNESAGITETVQSLRAVDYPSELFEVVVIADNCTDDTAAKAAAAGATVMVRHDKEKRGKGYALDHVFSATPPEVDAVVVIDADTLISPNLLRAFAARRDLGARAVQADYAVRNPDAGWRTRLIAIAFGAFHIVRSRARERLSLSCGLRGNGMCFSTELLREIPHNAYSVVEDVEYGVRLGEAGYRVHYADEAHVYGEMVTTSAAANTQRRRWEEGRKALIQQHARRLLSAGLRRPSRVLFDLALDLYIPPLSRIAVGVFLGALAAASLWLGLSAGRLSLAAYGLGLGAVVAYVLRGWSVSGTGLRGLLDLALAPVYVLWKLTLRFKKPPRATAEWVRTEREKPSS